MKPRTPEAAHLEADYLARVRAALAGLAEGEVAEILQGICEHIEEEAAALPSGDVSLTQMAGILEHLGPPEAYRVDEAGGGTGGMGTAVAGGGMPLDYGRPPEFTIGRCFSEAMEMYRRNFLPLLLASVIAGVLSTFTLFIVAGPLYGGMFLMLLRALDRPDHRVELGDLFGMFRRFWPFFAAFWLQLVVILVGMALCIVPGLLIGTLWLYVEFFMVEKNMGVWESLKSSQNLTLAPGRFGKNFLVCLIGTALLFAVGAVPYVGVLGTWVLEPLIWLFMASAYLRQTRAEVRLLDELLPAAAGVP